MAEAPGIPGSSISTPAIKDSAPPITPAEIAVRQFVRGSFLVSEGSLAIQKVIFDYAVAKDLLPDIEIPRHIPKYMLSLFPPGQHLERPADVIKDDRAFVWGELHKSKSEPKGIEAEKLVPVVLSEVLGREFKYQIVKRPKRAPDSDQHESYLRKFAVIGESTGSQITDQLCAELTQALDRLRAEPFSSVTKEMISNEALSPLPQLFQGSGELIEDMISRRLNAMGDRRILAYVEALWERNHPGESFFPQAPATT